MATDVGGVSDAALGGKTGLLVGPLNDEVARAIVTLATDGANAKHTSDRCHDACRQIVWTRCSGKTASDAVHGGRHRQGPAAARSFQTAAIQPAYSDSGNA